MQRSSGATALAKQTLLAIIMTVLSGVLGAPFMRLIRQTQGGARYWLTAALTSLAVAPALGAWAAVLTASCWLVVGVYCELERRGFSWETAGLVSLFTTSMIGGSGILLLLAREGVSNWPGFVLFISDKASLLGDMSGVSSLDPEVVASQAFSGWLVFLILCLGLAVIFERRLYHWFGLPRERTVTQLKPLEFRLPDIWQWITLLALLVSFVDFGVKGANVVGMNILNVSAVLYLFQGLSILEVLLNSLRMGLIPRVVAYVLLIGQLFFVLSAVGFLDFWIDFRQRFKRFAPKAGSDSQFGGPV